jgi:hypothetical protein
MYPVQRNCCILRIDPTEFTVSAIVEIINASSVLFANSYLYTDLGIFESDQLFIIKAYSPNILVVFNQSAISSNLPSESASIFFESPIYNFAAFFTINVSFDLMSLSISVDTTKIDKNKFVFRKAVKNEDIIHYNLNAEYSLDFVCGPIFEYYFTKSAQEMSKISINQTEVVTKTKIITSNVGIEFIQIIDLQDYNISNALTNFILIVGVEEMLIFEKFNNISTV